MDKRNGEREAKLWEMGSGQPWSKYFSRLIPSQVKLEFLSQFISAPILPEPKRSLFAMSLSCPSLLLSLPYECAGETIRNTLSSHSDEEEPNKYKPIT